MNLPVERDWFAHEDAGDEITLLWEPWLDPYFRSNIWLVRGRDRDLVVDTGNGVGDLVPVLSRLDPAKEMLGVVTHAHFDHVGGLGGFAERLCHREEASAVADPDRLVLLRDDYPKWMLDDMRHYGYEPAPCALLALPKEGFDVGSFETSGTSPTRLLEAGDAIDLGDRAFEVLHLPGHTRGSIGLWEDAAGILFTGDAAYVGDPLGFDDPAAAGASLEAMAALPVRIVHGGHNRSFDGSELRDLVRTTLAILG